MQSWMILVGQAWSLWRQRRSLRNPREVDESRHQSYWDFEWHCWLFQCRGIRKSHSREAYPCLGRKLFCKIKKKRCLKLETGPTSLNISVSCSSVMSYGIFPTKFSGRVYQRPLWMVYLTFPGCPRKQENKRKNRELSFIIPEIKNQIEQNK